MGDDHLTLEFSDEEEGDQQSFHSGELALTLCFHRPVSAGSVREETLRVKAESRFGNDAAAKRPFAPGLKTR